MERAAGIDPASPVWKTGAHPSIPDPLGGELRARSPCHEGTARLAGGSRPCRDNSPYWARRGDSNSEPAEQDAAAFPLSYVEIGAPGRIRTRVIMRLEAAGLSIRATGAYQQY